MSSSMIESALRGVVQAWQALPGGRYSGHSGISEVDAWLRDSMKPAIDAARAALKWEERATRLRARDEAQEEKL